MHEKPSILAEFIVRQRPGCRRRVMMVPGREGIIGPMIGRGIFSSKSYSLRIGSPARAEPDDPPISQATTNA